MNDLTKNELQDIKYVLSVDVNTLRPVTINFEEKTLGELKQLRNNFNLKEVGSEYQATAYLIKMIDILLDKVERLENE